MRGGIGGLNRSDLHAENYIIVSPDPEGSATNILK
jgi:hypothetical protein